MKRAFPTVFEKVFDTLAVGAAVGAQAFILGLDRRRAAWPRLGRILDGEGDKTELLELFCAARSGVFGFWLWLPFFNSFDTSTAFRVLAMLGTEGYWGFVMTAFALWRFDAILMNRARTRHNLTLSAVVMWGSLGVLFLLGNTSSPGGAVYLVLAGFEALHYRNQIVPQTDR